ncbi:hypothetical protein D3C78_496080 [compost metagenome]
MPSPRKESAASLMMAFATCTVEMTRMGDRQFGSMWRNMMRGARNPITWAASTYSFFFSASTEARTVRAYWGHSAMPMITTSIRMANFE